MAMPRKVHCVRCHRHVSDCGPLTARKRCFDCGVGVMIANARQLADKSGPAYDRWRLAMVDAVANLYRSPDPSTLDVAGETIEIAELDTPAQVLSS